MKKDKSKQLIITALITLIALSVAFGLCYMVYLKYKYLIH